MLAGPNGIRALQAYGRKGGLRPLRCGAKSVKRQSLLGPPVLKPKIILQISHQIIRLVMLFLMIDVRYYSIHIPSANAESAVDPHPFERSLCNEFMVDEVG